MGFSVGAYDYIVKPFSNMELLMRVKASRYVVDAKADTKEGVYEFLDDAVNVAVFVDCENVDPYAFGAESQIKREKEAFYNRYLKKGLLIKPVEVDGALKLQIEISKK